MNKRIKVFLSYILAVTLFLSSGCGWVSETVKDTYSKLLPQESETKQEQIVSASDVLSKGEVTEPATEEEPIESISEGHYAYETLDDDVKDVYDEIVHVLMDHDEKIVVSTLDIDVLDHAYKAVCADYGEIFWASGYVYTSYTRGDELVEIEYAPQYIMDYDERVTTQEQIDEKVDEILSGIPDGADDYAKVKYVFEYLASNVEYDPDAPNNQNIISTFLGGSTVCQGYACGTQYLLKKLGIQSAIVSGTAKGESHAWNLVKMDGDYYYVDTTWGNSSYSGTDSTLESPFINYNYLGVTTDQISRTHTSNGNFCLPVCNAISDNYYIREGRFFTEWNPEEVGTLLTQAYQARTMMSVRFASSDIYNSAFDYFIGDGRIVDYCSGLTSLTYVEDKEQNVITFLFGA